MDSIASEIEDLRKRLGKDIAILGHHYQNDDVIRHCDFQGDSLELARLVPQIDAKAIIFCGVYFMGESAALLTRPEQKVYLPEPDADCMMSLQAPGRLARAVLEQLKAQGRKIIPLAYVNTMLDLKAVVGEYGGAVCTSANAAKMLKWAFDNGDGVLFLPDKHLGRNAASQLGLCEDDWHLLRLNAKGIDNPDAQALDKKLLLWPGCCAIHARLKTSQLANARTQWPGCRIIVHPECSPELVNKCDAAGSTSFLIKEAQRVASESPGTTLVIGTEDNLVLRLAKRHSKECNIQRLGRSLCPHMAKVSAKKLLETLRGIESCKEKPIEPGKELYAPARAALERMLAESSPKPENLSRKKDSQ